MFSFSDKLKRLIPASPLLLALMLNSGCFYLVEEGKGGVAERFPMNVTKVELNHRINNCEKIIDRDRMNGQASLFPASYQQVELLLIESRRLYKAEFYTPAQVTLEKAENLLTNMEQNRSLLASQSTCELSNTKEICL